MPKFGAREPSAPDGEFDLVFSGSFFPGYKGGGPVKSVARILESASSARVLLITSDRDLGDERPYEGLSNRVTPYGAHRVFYFNHRSPESWVRLVRLLRSRAWRIIYMNSYWSPLYAAMPLALRACGVLPGRAALVAPRGSLAEAALEIKSSKKSAFFPLYRWLMRVNRAVFHASSLDEEKRILSLHPWARVVNIPPPHLSPTPHADCRGRAVPRVVYISRIAPIKNLHLALEALKFVESPIRLEVYGPVEDRPYWDTCSRLVEEAPSQATVEYMGPLSPTQVPSVLRDSDIFVLPTSGENYGHSIAEALAAGCSVAIPDTTPWTAVVRDGAGAMISGLTPQAVAQSLDALAEKWRADPSSLSEGTTAAYRRWLASQTMENPLDALL